MVGFGRDVPNVSYVSPNVRCAHEVNERPSDRNSIVLRTWWLSSSHTDTPTDTLRLSRLTRCQVRSLRYDDNESTDMDDFTVDVACGLRAACDAAPAPAVRCGRTATIRCRCRVRSVHAWPFALFAADAEHGTQTHSTLGRVPIRFRRLQLYTCRHGIWDRTQHVARNREYIPYAIIHCT